jgi:O-antigen ligase
MYGNKTIKKLIFFVSFFSYAGYYAGLALIMSSGQIELSRYYSIPLRLILVGFMIILIVKNVNHAGRHFKKGYLPVMILFAIVYIIKVVVTETNYSRLSRDWYEYIFYFLSYSIIPFFAYAFIDFEKYKKTILDALILSGFVLGGLSLYLYRSILTIGIGRISLIKYQFPNVETLSPLALSYSGVLMIVLCVYKLVYEKVKNFWIRAYLYLTIILSFIMFFLGASRGSLVVLLLCVPFILYHASFKNKSRILLLCIIAIPLMLYGAEVTGSAIFTRTENTIETGDASGRQQLWAMAYEEFKNFPFLGGRIEVSGIYPHNVFLELLMATGIFGFLLFLIVLFKSFARGAKLIKRNKIYMIPTLILINGLAQHTFSGSIYGAILLFVPMGMIYSSYIHAQRM